MESQAIAQATCTECGESDDNYHATDKTMDSEENSINHSVECLSCGEAATITLTPEGTQATENVSYEDASWNEDSDESSNSSE